MATNNFIFPQMYSSKYYYSMFAGGGASFPPSIAFLQPEALMWGKAQQTKNTHATLLVTTLGEEFFKKIG